jgi:hypothetical protein
MIKYWDLEEAIRELQRRQSTGITRELEESYNFSWLPKGKLYGFLARHIASPRLEELQFFKRCVRSGLQPLWLEYLDDKFCTNNPSKVRLVKLRILLGRGKRGGIKERVVKIVDHWPPSSMRHLRTCWGELLYKFHHRILNVMLGSVEILDISDWLRSWGRAINYYEPYLALAIAHGVLFESFESPGFQDLERFKNNVVLPAYRRVVGRWGLEPLIVYHPWPPEKEAMYLNYYPPDVLRFLPERR